MTARKGRKIKVGWNTVHDFYIDERKGFCGIFTIAHEGGERKKK